jgi:hypothetical protein
MEIGRGPEIVRLFAAAALLWAILVGLISGIVSVRLKRIPWCSNAVTWTIGGRDLSRHSAEQHHGNVSSLILGVVGFRVDRGLPQSPLR